MIELKNISKTWQAKDRAMRCALENISFKIARGKIVGIIGESGAGKSTLLRIFNLLVKPSAGQVLVNETDLLSLTQHELNKQRQRMGMVFQQFNLLQSRTAFENIALPLELQRKSQSYIEARVNTLLDLIHLSSHRDHYPHELSGGQMQRIAIARALTTEPDILLCDEPTSALDNKSTLTILNLLKEIRAQMNVTIIMVTHETSVAKYICDEIAVLHQGKLIEHGPTAKIFTHPESPITQQLLREINADE